MLNSIILEGMNQQGPVFWVCRSSAGSGKTFSLVKQFLTLCLREKSADAYVHILAITFTNNAAAEMKSRILARLHDFSQGTSLDKSSPGGQLFWMLQGDLGIDPLELESRAKATLSHILHHYHRFSVSTIDSFIHRIVRAFSRDLSQHPDFNIEMDTERVLEEVVDRCLDQAGKVDAVTKYLKKLVQIQMEDGKAWNPRSVMLEYAKTLTTELGMAALESQKELNLTLTDFENIFQNLFVIKDQLIQRPKQIAAQVHQLLGSCSSNLDDHWRKGYFLDVFAKMKDANTVFYESNPFIKKELSKWWTQGAEASWFRSNGGNPTVLHRFEAIADEVARGVDALWEWSHGREIQQLYLVESVIKNFYAMGLVHYLHELSEGLKLERNFLMIQDFHQMIAKVMINNPTPFVYEKVGERFDHLLFDEFQDTSKLQWRNFLPLVHQGMSKGGEIFVVGDGKQSIYRWRNGDVHQFVNLPEIPEDEGLQGLNTLLAAGYNSMELNTNRRSHQNVVLFNNKYFDALREKMTPANQRVYHNQAQLAHHPDPGYVRYKLFQSKNSAREDMMMDLVQSIQAAHADGFSYSDMAILTRKGRKETAPIAEALKAHGIPMNTHDSFLLSLSAKVRTVMSYLSFLAKPSEVYFRFDFLRSLSEIEDLTFDLTQAIEACMVVSRRGDVEYRRLGAIEAFIHAWNPMIKTRWETGLSAYDLAKSFIDDLQLGMDEYLEFLLDQLSQKSTVWGFYPAEVISWWSKAKEKLCIQSNVSDDAIRIMTIHRSKGLEFPVVFYPRFQSKNPSQNIWVPMDVNGIPLKDVYLRFSAAEPKHYQPDAFVEEYNNQLLDQFNLMYVAQTRAEERLYIFQEEIESDETKSSEEATINDTLFTKTFKEVFESLGSDTSTQTWELGTPQHHKGTPLVSAVEIRSLRTLGKAKKVKIRFSATQRKEGHDHWLARKRGDRTHRFLQLMLMHHDAQKAMEVFESQLGPVDEKEQIRWSAVLADADWNRLAQSSNHPVWRIEESLLLEEGKELRPDAYRVLEDRIELIDFKTGKEMAEHLAQIDDYSKVLFDIWKMPIHGMLYYTENQKWIRSTYHGHLF
ncbi:MAG: hypothetical protein RLY35_1563 [Bacteroidota bacterium]